MGSRNHTSPGFTSILDGVFLRFSICHCSSHVDGSFPRRRDFTLREGAAAGGRRLV